MLTVLDLFSGIGGISLGLESTGGFRTVAFCEIEPFPRLVLAKHWPGVPIFEDVRTLTAESLRGMRPDLICGGFPCQDVSVAGKGAGLTGSRSGLWFEFARLVGELGPRWVLAENVGALRTRGMDRVCSDLEAEGYAVWPLLVGAWAAGAPHRRDRVWIVARRLADAERRREGLLAGALGRETGGEGQFGDQSTAIAPGGGTSELAHASRAGQRGEPAPERTDGLRAGASGDEDLADFANHGCEIGSADHHPTWSREATGHGDPPRYGAATELDDSGRRGCGAERQFGPWSQPDLTSPRWPARPGEPQHEWEEPRLDFSSRRNRHDVRGLGSQGNAEGHSARTQPGVSQLPVGGTAHGLPERLARRANREALKALGNSVVSQVVYAIGRAILEAEAEFNP